MYYLVGIKTLINIGIFGFFISLDFSIGDPYRGVNASRRALSILSEGGLITEEEVQWPRKVLFAAALTYVAAALSTFLQLLRLVILFGGNNRRD